MNQHSRDGASGRDGRGVTLGSLRPGRRGWVWSLSWVWLISSSRELVERGSNPDVRGNAVWRKSLWMTQESHLPPDCFRVRINTYERSGLEGTQDSYVTSRLSALTSGLIQTTRIKPIQKSTQLASHCSSSPVISVTLLNPAAFKLQKCNIGTKLCHCHSLFFFYPLRNLEATESPHFF